jgi:hypothetical protein
VRMLAWTEFLRSTPYAVSLGNRYEPNHHSHEPLTCREPIQTDPLPALAEPPRCDYNVVT